MKTQKVTLNGNPHIFVKMAVTEAWLCKAVTGQTCPQRTSIGRTTLLQDLLNRIRSAADGDETMRAEGAGDPMNEVEGGPVPPPNKKKKLTKPRSSAS